MITLTTNALQYAIYIRMRKARGDYELGIQCNSPFFAFLENIETNLNIRHFFRHILQQTGFPTSPDVENDDKARCKGRTLLSIQLSDETYADKTNSTRTTGLTITPLVDATSNK